MAKEKKYYRAINFDLGTDALRDIFGENGRSSAYTKLEKFFESKNFSHRQYSGYVSNNKLGDIDVIALNEELFKKFPWLEKCVQKMDVTNIGKRYDMIKLHNDIASSSFPENEMSKESESEKDGFRQISLSELKNNISEVEKSKAQNNRQNTKSNEKSRNNDRDR